MPRFAANVSMLYTEHAFLDRFAAAAADGFRAVEFLFPYAYPAEAIVERLREAGTECVLVNLPPGDWEAGERGFAALPGREAAFRAGLEQAIAYAKMLGCARMHAMAGLVPSGADRARCHATYVSNLRYAAALTAAAGLTLLIEPINPRDVPGYFLHTQAEAHAVVTEVGAPNLKVQMDLYHCQIVEGDVATKIRTYLPAVGHIQIAGVPERHEPDLGELNYPYLFGLLDELGYSGWVSAEYRPRAQTSAGLGWAAPYLKP